MAEKKTGRTKPGKLIPNYMILQEGLSNKCASLPGMDKSSLEQVDRIGKNPFSPVKSIIG